MSQLTITILIIIFAVAGAVFLIIQKFTKKKKNKDICSGCSSDCDSCHFYKEMQKARKNKPTV